MAYEARTKATEASVSDFIAAVEDPRRRADSETLCALFEALSGEPPVMWGPSIVGFGRYRYRYDSGHEGEWMRIGFSPRKANMTVYIMPGFKGREDLLARIRKARTSVSCLYINRLDKIDMEALRELAVASLAEMREKYPD